MTATTPPITAWYVLEVEGTGLASAQMAKGEKTERRCCGPCCAAEAAARPTDCSGLQAGALEGPILLVLVPSARSCCRQELSRWEQEKGRQQGKQGGESNGHWCQLLQGVS